MHCWVSSGVSATSPSDSVLMCAVTLLHVHIRSSHLSALFRLVVFLCSCSRLTRLLNNYVYTTQLLEQTFVFTVETLKTDPLTRDKPPEAPGCSSPSDIAKSATRFTGWHSHSSICAIFITSLSSRQCSLHRPSGAQFHQLQSRIAGATQVSGLTLPAQRRRQTIWNRRHLTTNPKP
jgi:hypothetical protein